MRQQAKQPGPHEVAGRNRAHNPGMKTAPIAREAAPRSRLFFAFHARTGRRWCAALGVAASAGAVAQESASARSGPPVLPRWEAGALGLLISQQAYPGADQQVQRQLVLPYLVYRGPVLRADRGTAGIRAVQGDSFELDIGASGALGSSAQRIEARRGMPDLGTLVEFGPRLRWTLHRAPDGSRWRFDLPVRSVHDLSDGLERRGTAIEPEIKWQGLVGGGYFVNTGLSAVLGDRSLAQTFYGVAPSQATVMRPAYSAKAGLITWRLAGAVGWRLSPNWNAFTYARVDSVSGAANESSPLVRQTTGVSAGVGLSYVWQRSSLPGVD